MDRREQAELLRAVVVLAAADGVISSSERGLLGTLAGRVGITRKTLGAMVNRAIREPQVRDELFRRASSDPERTLELLVAAAQIDGSIHEEERNLLEAMMEKLDVPASRFDVVFRRGIERAVALRRKQRRASGD